MKNNLRQRILDLLDEELHAYIIDEGDDYRWAELDGKYNTADALVKLFEEYKTDG